MKDILTAPFMVEMIRTATNMYGHGWDERNGGNISLLLDEAELKEYLDMRPVRVLETGFSAPELAGKCFLVTGTGKYFKGTAETSGADGVIIPKRRSASLNATVFKTSAGAASYVPVARVPNLAACIDTLKENGVWIYGTDASGSDYSETDFTGGVGLVIGSEGFGISKLIAKKCDFMIKLPMLGRINSLNASVAAGIFMYEVLRQRRGSK